ncbi:hypothetical protein VTK73DRAFT_6066 [Phialemonium thermophilum]|uniref:pyridoxal 5'-phosphate synthase n=1 Tax=Phialemonium thermophilum TaxID=223376 RepID=A0ABR3WKU1_9PEZI
MRRTTRAQSVRFTSSIVRLRQDRLARSVTRNMALYPRPGGSTPPVSSSPAPTPVGRAGQFLKAEAQGGLRRRDLRENDPLGQFHDWFAAAAAATSHPETCTLSTASLPSGRVSARVVYLKELDPAGGFVVYSNFGTSRKARDLFGSGDDGSVPNPWVALTFWWEPLERQVRVEGRAKRMSAEESQAYFDTRVRGSRIGAWASRQSTVLRPLSGGEQGPESAEQGDAGQDDGRAQLERWVREAEERFAGVERIPCPEYWGGLRIVPERVEFWQGRQNRLHDRFVYDRVRDGGSEDADAGAKWTLERLSP